MACPSGPEAMNMENRCLFLQDEVTIAFVDDFLVLATRRVFGNVFEGLPEPAERHDLMFQFVH
jgi:hypothetical protein